MVDAGVISGFLDGLRPAPRIGVSDWACNYRYMTPDISPVPGPYDVNFTPYLEDIMNDLSPYNPVEEVIFKKSSQIGATQAGNNWIGAIIHLYKGPVLMVLPTKDLAKRNSKTNIESMIRTTPALRSIVGDSRDRDSGNTLLEKKFPNGFLAICGANSPNDARSTSFRYVYMDEISAYPVDMGGEGDPYELFAGRAKFYGDRRKIFTTSTPTTEGVCRITSLYEGSDKRRYFIRCPKCGEAQYLEFEFLRWKPGDYDHVWYECRHKNCRIDEHYKSRFMLKSEGAEWVPTDLSRLDKKKKGYHLSALYAPAGTYRWGAMAKKFDEINGDVQKEKTFINLDRGDTYKVKLDKMDFQGLIDRAKDYQDGKPVNEVAVLTAGVDIQKNRIEVEVVGWGANKAKWSVDYKVLEGDTDLPQVWTDLREYLLSDFTREDGGVMQIAYSCIDSGYLASKVYEFCRDLGGSRCSAVKGSETLKAIASAGKTVNITKDGAKVGVGLLRELGVNIIKEQVYSDLRISVDYETGDVPPGVCYFPQGRTVYYFKGLCSEVQKLEDGKYVWDKIVLRNEPLDCRVYNYAAADLFGITRKKDDWFDKECAKYVPERKQFTQPVQTRERRPSDHWNKLGK